MTSIQSLTFDADESSSYSHVVSSLNKAETAVTQQTPPHKIEFTLQKSEWGFKYGCDGEATISSLPGGKSNVVIKVRANKDTFIYTLAATLLMLVLFWWLWWWAVGWEWGLRSVIIGIPGGVGMFWYYVVSFPGKTLRKIKAAAIEEIPLVSMPAPSQPVSTEGPIAVTDLVGKSWANYRIVSQIGRGGMAIVYKAYHAELDRYVAIKFLLPQGILDQTLITRFTQEARLIAKLRHPNIVTVLDFGEHRGVAYIVMEYVDGKTLKERLGKPMALESALDIAIQVGRALDYAHSQGVIHRDVKPSNILLPREDWTLLSDFGIAKVLESSTQFTQTGLCLGTPEYMAPEQGKGLKVDARCDIYALGVVLYEMLTGTPPFTGDTPLNIMFQHCNEPPPPPRSLNPDIPEAHEQIVLKAMAKDPALRYASAGDMVAALESLRTSKETSPPSSSPEAPTLVESSYPLNRRRYKEKSGDTQ